MTRTGSGPLSPDELADWYAEPADLGEGTWVRASFITSLDGRVTGPDGRSGSLNAGSEGDAAVFAHLREWADVVVVGAGTVIEEEYTPLPGVALAVVTRGEVLPPTLAHTEPDAGGPETGEVVLVGGKGELTAAQIRAALVERGWRRIVVEGGPHLLDTWLREGLLDELCLTVRPVLAGGGGPLLVGRDVELDRLAGEATHLLTWGGDVLLRTRLR
ncbi:dihydrofolate reductase family protein [Ornithinimicrobium avium]|uniref:Bacterial bifunctional deaminase-reductase C-terminal domain-containing protein n=1 Tax=Ornithinimicrobium avium TaxID=2283195 RepID=A0A345NJX1_9MICO|nr:dihydrofolate reductase family protein [Ornithinimicrobium avium]AXH95329.1 hypothetical protein DV701_03540 [Ornithinimicrobium avium]